MKAYQGPRGLKPFLVLGVLALSGLVFLEDGSRPFGPGRAQPVPGGLSLDLLLPVGGTTTTTVRLVNPGPAAQELRIDLRDYDRDRKGALRLLPPGTHPRSLAPYLVVSPTQLTLAPGTQAALALTLNLPAAATGPLWTGLLLRTAEKGASNSNTNTNTNSNGDEKSEGVPVTLEVVQQLFFKVRRTDPANAVNEGRITDADAAVLFIESEPRIEVTVEYENTGTTFQRPRGEARLIDSGGQVLLTQEIPPFPVLPGGRRLVQTHLEPEDLLPSGPYVILIILDFGGDFLLGAQLHLRLP